MHQTKSPDPNDSGTPLDSPADVVKKSPVEPQKLSIREILEGLNRIQLPISSEDLGPEYPNKAPEE